MANFDLMKLLAGAALVSLQAVAAPINWDIQLNHFEKVYKSPLQCSKGGMSEMDCNNHRARALKRFQKEWEANAYWSNGQVVSNPAADKRVNSEQPK